MWNLKILAAIATLTITSLAGTAIYAYSSGKQSGMQQVQTLWDSDRLAIAEAQAGERMKAAQKQKALEALIAQQRRNHRAEVDRIVAQYSADLDGLRDRPEARADFGGVPEGADAGIGCTGLGLSRPDAEFLVWVGREASRTQAALRACVTAYEEVRRQVNREEN
jgi:hypothetical protein